MPDFRYYIGLLAGSLIGGVIIAFIRLKFNL